MNRENDTLTRSNQELKINSNREKGSQSDYAQQQSEFLRSVRLYKFQSNMEILEKHTVEVSHKYFKAEK